MRSSDQYLLVFWSVSLNNSLALKSYLSSSIYLQAEQSRRGKLGDRFWYENGDLPHSFSESKIL